MCHDPLEDVADVACSEGARLSNELVQLCQEPRRKVNQLSVMILWMITIVGLVCFGGCVWLGVDEDLPTLVLILTAIGVAFAAVILLVFRAPLIKRAERKIAPIVREVRRQHATLLVALPSINQELADELTRLASADQQ